MTRIVNINRATEKELIGYAIEASLRFAHHHATSEERAKSFVACLSGAVRPIYGEAYGKKLLALLNSEGPPLP